jgi:hypothetical protein
MFLCKLWELVKYGTNDNSFEYVKKIHLNMLEMNGTRHVFCEGTFLLEGGTSLKKSLATLLSKSITRNLF